MYIIKCLFGDLELSKDLNAQKGYLPIQWIPNVSFQKKMLKEIAIFLKRVAEETMERRWFPWNPFINWTGIIILFYTNIFSTWRTKCICICRLYNFQTQNVQYLLYIYHLKRNHPVLCPPPLSFYLRPCTVYQYHFQYIWNVFIAVHTVLHIVTTFIINDHLHSVFATLYINIFFVWK